MPVSVKIDHDKWPTGGCRNKIKYGSKKTALGALRVMKKSGRARTAERLHVYKCRECGSFHLGNVAGKSPPPLKHIRVSIGDVVEIRWKEPDGTESHFRYLVESKASQ